MRRAHSITLTVFCKEDEGEEKIQAGLKHLVPFPLEEEKVQLQKKIATGFEEKKITIFTILLEKEKHTNQCLDFLKTQLNPAQRDLLIEQVDSRLDANLNFFLRLDKEKWLEGKPWITDSGNCFHIKISLAAFPKRREKGLALVEKIFKEGNQENSHG